MANIPGLDALRLAINPITGAVEAAGPMVVSVTGTVNILGGGSGGTSSIDNSNFTAGANSITVAGGYHGGRSVASGAAAALAIDGSGMLLVDVGAGGAGGGVANLTVRGSANQDIHVGYVGGGSVNSDGGAYLPILGTVNLGAGAAPFASVAVYGSPANPVYNVGSVNVVNTVTITGTVNAIGGSGFATAAVYGSPAFPVYAVGSVNVQGSLGVGQIGSPWGVAGSLFATVNVVNFPASAAFATAAVYGSPAFPVYAVGSVNVVNAVGIFGSVNVLGTVSAFVGTLPLPVANVGGSILVSGTLSIGNNSGIFGTVGVYGSVSILGSVNLGAGAIVGIFGSTSGVASVNLGGVGVVDTRGSMVATQWILSFGGSGQTVVAGSAPAAMRNWFSSFHMIATGTVDIQWQSPSGTAISGSMRLLPGAGFAQAGGLLNAPVVIGATQAPIFMIATGTQNVGGIVTGWVT
jgi:hypothetical protein